MNTFRLPDQTHIGIAHFFVSSLDQSLAFYSDLMGFKVLKRENDLAVLSADGTTPHVLLSERPGWQPKPQRSTGLYHVAILLPSRMELARLFKRMVMQRYPFGGFSDHAVSEALYLSDPDGNGLELYRDRPREEWPRANGNIAMTTQPLDVEALLAEADDTPWTGIHPQTVIGHVHLHVADLARAKAFYSDLLGLDVASDWSGHGALFMSAGGYHHHLGLNIWAGSRPQPPQTLGLRSYSFQIPDQQAWQMVQERLQSANVGMEQLGGKTVLTHDPDNNAIELTLETQ
jgi:catechol 2,3-dioxygenase